MNKKVTIALGCVAVVGVIIAICISFMGSKEQPYTPSEKFAEAYNMLDAAINPQQPTPTHSTSAAPTPRGKSSGEAYIDIEKTIRVMHSMEIAQQKSVSFDELLLHLAKEDYTGVAPDVLEAKKKLFPVMEKLQSLQEQLDSANSPMGFLKAMTENLTSKNTMMNILSITTIEIAAVNALDSAYKTYLKQQQISDSIKKELQQINREYIKYIEEYSPIYHKYMKQWDALCLLKDKAFIDCYSGRYVDAQNNAEMILKRHPNNAEGLLLKSLSLISQAPKVNNTHINIDDIELNKGTLPTANPEAGEAKISNPLYLEADRTLDYYIEQHPGKAAPALLLKGMLHRQMGNTSRAFSYFDQAAIEYPRQAESVSDMLNAYYNRAHLTQSAEGLYLLNYYCSTMEGYGIFSPNFQKAAMLSEQGRIAESRQEIYKHFFRRGNQSARDGMLFDMQFCENNLPSSFKSLFLSSSYIDITHEPSSVFLGMGSKDEMIDVTLRNRSDSRLENVRVFLCIHYTGMYVDDYAIVKIAEDKNIIEPYEQVVFKEVNLGEGKSSEITHIRAIVMTDNQIGWVDTPTMKLSKVLSRNSDQVGAAEQASRNAIYLQNSDMDAPAIKSLIASEMRINGQKPQTDKITIEPVEQGILQATKDLFMKGVSFVSFGATDTDKNTVLELPRLLTLFSPVCTINPITEGSKTIYAEEEVLDGGYIRTTFSRKFEDNTTTEFYIYGNCIAFRVDIERVGDKFQLKNIETL